MTGLDKMKSQILNEAKAAADGKVAEAKRQAEEMINLAKEEAEKKRESISRKSEADVQRYQERTASSIDLQRRTKLLAAKQEVIAEVLDKAYEKLSGMEEEEYFAMLLKILVRYNAAGGRGNFLFCKGSAENAFPGMKNRYRRRHVKTAAR